MCRREVIPALLVLLVGCGALTDPPQPECRTDCVDAGGTAPDGGLAVDAGSSPDAGEGSDAGAEPDAGSEVDAGTEDAGMDAGMEPGCTWDAGNPANLLANPGFECGAPPDGWATPFDSALVAEGSDSFAGAQAARVTATGARMSLFPAAAPVKGNTSVRTFCASAQVKGTADGTVHLTIQRYALGGGAVDQTFSAPLTTSWQKIRTSARTTAFDDQVTLKVSAEGSAGTALLVDEAVLWESADGGCRER